MRHARATVSIGVMNIADLIRRLENLLRAGTIAEVDHASARCRVTTGGLTTGWLPWFTRRAGSTTDWDPPSVGEQCVVLCPSGIPEVGFVLVGVYSTANPPRSNSPDRHRIQWANGDFLEHDAASGALTISCAGPVKILGSRIDLNE